MSRFNLLILVFLLFACQKELDLKIDNVEQLSFEGDNGEAYLSDDQTRLVFQSKRSGNDCDKLYTINVDGSNLEEFELKDGAFTCAYFSLEDESKLGNILLF